MLAAAVVGVVAAWLWTAFGGNEQSFVRQARDVIHQNADLVSRAGRAGRARLISANRISDGLLIVRNYCFRIRDDRPEGIACVSFRTTPQGEIAATQIIQPGK
jgi:hypothetical protein